MKIFLPVFLFSVLIFSGCFKKEKSHYQKALAAFDSSNYEAALSEIKIAIDKKENDSPLYFMNFFQAELFEKSGNLDSALSSYKKAQQENPVDDLSFLRCGNIYNLLGKHEDALSSYSEALKINPRLVEAHLKRGDLYTAIGKDTLAFKDFSSVLLLYPENDYALLSRGMIYQRFKEFEKCCSDLERASTLGNETAKEFLPVMCPGKK